MSNNQIITIPQMIQVITEAGKSLPMVEKDNQMYVDTNAVAVIYAALTQPKEEVNVNEPTVTVTEVNNMVQAMTTQFQELLLKQQQTFQQQMMAFMQTASAVPGQPVAQIASLPTAPATVPAGKSLTEQLLEHFPNFKNTLRIAYLQGMDSKAKLRELFEKIVKNEKKVYLKDDIQEAEAALHALNNDPNFSQVVSEMGTREQFWGQDMLSDFVRGSGVAAGSTLRFTGDVLRDVAYGTATIVEEATGAASQFLREIGRVK